MNKNTMERHLIESAAMRRLPVSGSIELLPLCNMNCDMCYVRLSHSEMSAQGRLCTPKEWLDIGRQMQKSGVLFLQLTGGEPLLYPGFKEVYLGLKQMGLILTLNTNGTLLDKAWADFFAQQKPRRINLTLYGASASTYRDLCHYEAGFERAIRALNLLKERDIDVKINVSLVKANLDDLTQILDIADAADIPISIDTYMCPATRERNRPFSSQSRLSPSEAAKARAIIEKYGQTPSEFAESVEPFFYKAENPQIGSDRMKCMAGKSSFAINWKGYMQPCVTLAAPSASVLELGFDRAWETIVREVERIRLSSKCAECSMRDICQTCAACALAETGRLDGVPDYMCEYTEQTIHFLKAELYKESDDYE